jgi:hypothetical protein
MYSTNARNTMLDAIGTTHLSLHTAYSSSGASEVTGGSPAYARKAISFSAASGGSKANSTTPTFDVPTATTVRFIGMWDAVTAGNFKGMVANGGSEFEFYVDVTNDKILKVAHGFSNTQKIVFYNGTAPGGLTEGTVYFVVGATTDDFQVAATSGGAAINLTSQAADSVVCSAIVEEVYGAQGTMSVNPYTISLNN